MLSGKSTSSKNNLCYPLLYPLLVFVSSFICDFVINTYGSLAALLINENGKHCASTNKLGFLSHATTSFLWVLTAKQLVSAAHLIFYYHFQGTVHVVEVQPKFCPSPAAKLSFQKWTPIGLNSKWAYHVLHLKKVICTLFLSTKQQPGYWGVFWTAVRHHTQTAVSSNTAIVVWK